MSRAFIVSDWLPERNRSEARFDFCRAAGKNIVRAIAQRAMQKRQLVQPALPVEDAIRARVAAGGKKCAVLRRLPDGVQLISKKRLCRALREPGISDQVSDCDQRRHPDGFAFGKHVKRLVG